MYVYGELVAASGSVADADDFVDTGGEKKRARDKRAQIDGLRAMGGGVR
jgi:hypothetical protein